MDFDTKKAGVFHAFQADCELNNKVREAISDVLNRPFTKTKKILLINLRTRRRASMKHPIKIYDSDKEREKIDLLIKMPPRLM
jgi:hypothetical protein